MSVRKLSLRLLLLPLLGAPLAAVADPIYSMTLLPDGVDTSALNKAGQLAGSARGGAAVWSATSISDFLPGAEGLAIDSHGDVAGRFGSRGVVYSGDGEQILALACREGVCTNVRLDPITSAVPEPRSVAMLVVGLALLGSRRQPGGASEKFSL